MNGESHFRSSVEEESFTLVYVLLSREIELARNRGEDKNLILVKVEEFIAEEFTRRHDETSSQHAG